MGEIIPLIDAIYLPSNLTLLLPLRLSLIQKVFLTHPVLLMVGWRGNNIPYNIFVACSTYANHINNSLLNTCHTHSDLREKSI